MVPCLFHNIEVIIRNLFLKFYCTHVVEIETPSLVANPTPGRLDIYPDVTPAVPRTQTFYGCLQGRILLINP